MDRRSVGRLFCSQIFKNTHQEEPHHEKEHHTAADDRPAGRRRGGRMAVQLGGVILGAVIYYIVYQVIIFAGFDTDLLKMFSAVVVAVFLGAPHVKAQLKAHSHSKKGDSGHAENE